IACLLGHEDYHAEAVAETDIRAALIRRGLFDELIADSSEFRRFVFTAFSLRVTSLFRLFEEVVFSRVDVRLAQLLARTGSANLRATHQSLANELGSAREVVSRLLNPNGGAGCGCHGGRSKLLIFRHSRLAGEAPPDLSHRV